MSAIGNLLWFFSFGLILALQWWLTGLLLFCSIIGIPWAKACFVIGQLALFPFGKEAISRKDLKGGDDIGTGGLGMLGNVVWFFIGGLWLALSHCFAAFICAVTVIGIPFALQHLKLAGLALAPIGKIIVSKEIAAAAKAASAQAFVAQSRGGRPAQKSVEDFVAVATNNPKRISVGAGPTENSVPTSRMQQNAIPTAQPATDSIVDQGSGGSLLAVAKGVVQFGTQAGPWTFATARRGWAHLLMAPGKIDPLLKSTAGEDNVVIYRFFQVVLVVVLVGAVFGVLALLWLASWIWCSVPGLAVLLGIGLLLVGGKTVEQSRAAGGRIAGVGLVMLLLGLPLTLLHVSFSMGDQRQEKEIRQANEQVALLVKTAQDNFDKNDLDKAEHELRQVSLVSKATDTQAAVILQGKIQALRHDAAVNKANRDVREFVKRAEMDLSGGRLEAAEEKLTMALAVQNATETANAKELLAKIPARRQELVNEKVTKLTAIATESYEAGDFKKAMQVVNEAIVVKDATNIGEAEELLDKMGDARPDLLARDAMQAIQQQRYSIAVKRLKAFLANPRSNQKPMATQVLKLVEFLQDDDKVQASLKAMSDAQLKSLSEGGKLPDNLATANTALTEAVKAALVRNLPRERNRRQAEEQERLAEKAKEERERLAERAKEERERLAEKAKEDEEKAARVAWDDVDAIYNIKSKCTELQKKEAWKYYKGKKAKWTGEVSSVGETFGQMTLHVKMNPQTLISDLLIRLPDEQRANAMKLSKGDKVTFTGTLHDWGTLMPTTLNDGAILSYAKQ